MKKLVLSLLIVFIVVFLVVFVSYKNGISSVGNSSKEIEFKVDKGSSFLTIAKDLKKAKLIKSELFYKIYIKLHHISNIESGVYILNNKMDVEDITKILQGKSINPNTISITFKEGYDMTDIIKEITTHTNNSEEDIINTLKDTEYLNSLIDKYWFIDENILNEELYYSLEGYLYPNTYQFSDKNVSVEDIFNTMISEMNKKLTDIKSDILNSNYKPHQILTLASIIELEGVHSNDRAGIASVFYNRLNSNMNLGSDVTTYYGARVKMSERDLYAEELNSSNPYNTRNANMAGRLPVGPICNPSIESIKASVNPGDSDYFFFVADKNKKTYFSKTYQQHTATVNKLKQEGLWYEY